MFMNAAATPACEGDADAQRVTRARRRSACTSLSQSLVRRRQEADCGEVLRRATPTAVALSGKADLLATTTGPRGGRPRRPASAAVIGAGVLHRRITPWKGCKRAAPKDRPLETVQPCRAVMPTEEVRASSRLRLGVELHHEIGLQSHRIGNLGEGRGAVEDAAHAVDVDLEILRHVAIA